MKNKALTVVLVLAALVVIFGFLKDQIIKTVVVITARQVIGADVTIDHFSLSLTRQSVHMRGLKIFNPAGFPEKIMLDVTDAVVACDLPAIMRGTLHLPYVEVNLKEVTVVRNKARAINVQSLKCIPQSGTPSQTEGVSSSAKSTQQKQDMAMTIDRLVLSVGRVVYQDHASDPPSQRVIDIDVKNREYRDITSAAQLAGLLATDVVMPVLLKDLGVHIKGINPKVMSGLLESVGRMLK